ncbi:MAG: glycine cleavage system aminomethyltransferase GcvT [Sterolibacteriaceae bacterium MAG5]|nr:glycine cleavage system aminomethyltransferase GcvT [Candidatus Nitricoxidireducens bremensis]
MAKRTPLYEAHVAAGAKIVDFAGWDMPINYGSQIEEHHTVRSDAGMFDVSHMRAVDVEGKDARAYLRRLVANDVAKLELPGKALYSCMLKEDGGVIDDLIIYFFTPERYRIVVNAGTADKDLAWMKAQAAGFAVTVTDHPEYAMIAVQGPNARELFWTAFPVARAHSVLLQPFQAAEWDGWLVARTGYTGEDGFEITLPAGQAVAVWDKLKAAGVAPIGLGARDTLRLEAGMNLYGQDMDEGQNPLESGLAWTVDMKDAGRDFVGRKALEALKPTRQFVGLLLLDRGVLRAHQKVVTAKGDGETTSGSFAPTLNQSIALARIPVGVALGDTVEVEVRDKRLKAKVVKPNFARHGKALI